MLPAASDIEYFLQVAATGNVSRAAGRLGITQPSLSLALQRLEKVVGAELLIRERTGVRLTPAGARLAARGKAFLEEWKRLRDETAAHQTEVAGRLTLGCHPSVALYTLNTFLPQLLESYAKLEIDLVHGLSRTITEDVIAFKVDFGIVVNPIRHPDLVIRELCRDEVGLWHASNALSDVLIHDPSLIQTQDILRRLGRKGIAFSRSLVSGNLEVVASLARAGAGVAILPERVAKQAGAGLKRFGKGLPVFEDCICLVYRADAQKGAAARALIQGLSKAWAISFR